MHEMPCSDVYRSCHRERLREDVLSALTAKGLVVTGRDQELKEEFRRQFRMLDYCRALHAEENAILNLAKNGRSVPLHECCLYTTTYPCRLCANKIVNIGLKRIVYLEPYPDQEAKHILKTAGVSDDLFEGVTFKAYFRIYGEEK
jgi:deoxycytidylate deaminase